jgi:hypothetical protein
VLGAAPDRRIRLGSDDAVALRWKSKLSDIFQLGLPKGVRLTAYRSKISRMTDKKPGCPGFQTLDQDLKIQTSP